MALLLFLPLISATSSAQSTVLIIDDIGYNLMLGTAVAELPFPVTLAVIPFSPHGQTIANLAKSLGKEVIIHSPMASIHDHKLDPGGLHGDMSEAEFYTALDKQLAELPQATGLNNHMGSQLTQQPQAMTWLMQRLKQNKLFFIDSRTIPESIALRTALQYQVTAWQRDVFLDHERDKTTIEQQLQRLVAKSKQRGLAFGIGHPYAETLEVLTQQWPVIQSQGVSLVLPSALPQKEPLKLKKEPVESLVARKSNKKHTEPEPESTL